MIKNMILFLTAAVVVISAAAQGSGTFDIVSGKGTGDGFSWNKPVLIIEQNGTYTVQGVRKTTANSIRVNDSINAVITFTDVEIEKPVDGCPLYLGNGASVRLILKGRNILTADKGRAGIRTTGATLTVEDGTEDGTGRLIVVGAGGGAGIGGDRECNGGDVVIRGGILRIIGGEGSKNIVLNREGNITTKGSYSGGAGIGGGGGMAGSSYNRWFPANSEHNVFVQKGGDGGNLTVTGGKLSVYSGKGANDGYCVGSGGDGFDANLVPQIVRYDFKTTKVTMIKTSSEGNIILNPKNDCGGTLTLDGSSAVLTLGTSNMGTNAARTLLNGTVNGRGADDLAGFYDKGQQFIAAKAIKRVPDEIKINKDLTLDGEIVPKDATFKNIVWSIEDAGTSGASINGNTLRTAAKGEVKIQATIFTDNGSVFYQQTFVIRSK